MLLMTFLRPVKPELTNPKYSSSGSGSSVLQPVALLFSLKTWKIRSLLQKVQVFCKVQATVRRAAHDCEEDSAYHEQFDGCRKRREHQGVSQHILISPEEALPESELLGCAEYSPTPTRAKQLCDEVNTLFGFAHQQLRVSGSFCGRTVYCKYVGASCTVSYGISSVVVEGDSLRRKHDSKTTFGFAALAFYIRLAQG